LVLHAGDRSIRRSISAKLDYPSLSSLCKVHRGHFGHTPQDRRRQTSPPLLRRVEAAVQSFARSLILCRAESHCRRSRPSISTVRSGGDEEIRTPDPLLAKEVLYQLSYIPERDLRTNASERVIQVRDAQVGVSGLEPETSALSGQCSNHLS
jgi:hypothetical protein